MNILNAQRVIFSLLSLAIWFNGVEFQVGRASVRSEHFLVILIFFVEFLNRRRRKVPFKLNLPFWMWVLMGAISTFLGTVDIWRGYWIHAQYAAGLIFLSNRDDLYPGGNGIRIQARIASTISIVYLVSYLFNPIGVVFQLSGDVNLFTGYSLEPNLMGSQALLLWVLLYSNRKHLSRTEKTSLFLLPLIMFISLTRAVWLGFICVLVMILVRKFKMASIYIISLAFVAFQGVNAFIKERVSTAEDVYWNLNNLINLQSGTARYRQNVYSQALSEISDTWLHFWFGHGIASFPEMHPVDSSGVSSAYLSNAFIGLLFETGVLGTAIFILMIGVYSLGSFSRFEISLYLFALAIVSSTTSPLWLIFPWFYLRLLGQARASQLHPV